MNLKGTLPALILNRLSRGPCHGYRIVKDIQAASGGVLDFREGTLYPVLHQLEKNSLVTSYEETEQNRRRRYYKLTAKGRKALKEERNEWDRLSTAVHQAIGEGAS